MPSPSLSLLFVCTANIARSPYAERRARMLLGEASSVRVGSAGVPGYPDRPMDAEMAEQLRMRAGDPTGHVSRCLDEDILDGADIVLTFAFEHQLRILREWPQAADRIFGLRQFADALGQIDATNLDGPALVAQVRSVAPANSMAFDLDDPHGRGRRAAKDAASGIDGCILPVVASLLGQPVDTSVNGAPRRALARPAPRRLRPPAPRRAIG